jgi:hypothetical protein
MIAGHPVDSGDYSGVSARAPAVQDPNRNQSNTFRHSVGRRTHRSRHVSAVAVAVVGRAAGHGVESADRAAAELGMRQSDSCVDYVSSDSRAGRVVRVAVWRGDGFAGRYDPAPRSPAIECPMPKTSNRPRCTRHWGRYVVLPARAAAGSRRNHPTHGGTGSERWLHGHERSHEQCVRGSPACPSRTRRCNGLRSRPGCPCR